MIKANPEIFLDACRFDVPAKYIYAHALENNTNLDFAYNLYKEHLKVWNDHKHGDGKDGIQEYVDTFKSLLHSIKTEGFNSEKSLVSVTEDLRLLNGGHRVAACLLYGKDIWYKVGGAGQTDVNYEYFQNKRNFVPEGLSKKWCDAIAVEYCKLKPNTFIVTIFPSAVGKRSEAESVIKEKADIFYKKTIQLSNEGPLNLMKELYYGEAWGGGTTGCDAGSFGGLKQKVNLCFREKGPIVVYAITAQSYEDTRRIKEKIRKLYNISNHSVHINDTTEQTVRLARCLFNDNGIHFMNSSVPAYFNNFESYIKFFKGYIEDNSLNPDDYCVTASSVLSRYGLREGNDLDYLHKGQEIHGHNMVHSHNSYAPGRYHTSVDDIIYNPDNYFYFNGVKFASLDTIKKLKEKRMEEKDKKDLKLMEIVNVVILASGHPKPNRDRHLEVFNGMPLIDSVVKACRVDNTSLYVVIDSENIKLRNHVNNIPNIQILTPKDKKMYSTFESAFSPEGDCIMVAGDLTNLKNGDVKKFVDSEHRCAIMKYKIPWGGHIKREGGLIRRGDIGDSINKISEEYKDEYLSKENYDNAKKYFKMFFPNANFSEYAANYVWTWMDYSFYNEIMSNPSCDSHGEKGAIFFEHQIYLDND